MKTLRILLGLGVMAGALTTCKPEPDFLGDGKPRIRSIAFPGIAPADVNLNQADKVISVRVPATLDATVANVFITLTDGAQLMRESVGPQPSLFTAGDGIGKIFLTDASGSPNEYSSVWLPYTVKLIPNGALAVAPMTGPLELVLEDRFMLRIPMMNLYAHPLPRQIQFTYQATGEVLKLDASTDLTPFTKGWDERTWGRTENNMNYLLASIINVGLRPGAYSVAIIAADGQVLKLPRPLNVRKGPVYIDEIKATTGFFLIIPPDGGIVFEGYNLFEDNIILSLTDRNGQTLPLASTTFARSGRRLVVRMPNGTAEGHYILRIVQRNDESRYACLQVEVRNGSIVPYEIVDIYPIGEPYIGCTVPGPLVVTRNSMLRLISAYGSDRLIRAKFVPVSDASRQYFAEAKLVVWSNNNSGLPPNGYPYIMVGNDIPNGEYRVLLQFLDKDGNVTSEGKPFWRTVIVQ